MEADKIKNETKYKETMYVVNGGESNDVHVTHLCMSYIGKVGL